MANRNDEALTNRGKYQIIIRMLLYLTVTRPDISYRMQTLSQFLQSPKKSHMTTIIKFVTSKSGLGILLSSSSSNVLISHCNSNWATCSVSRSSVIGFSIMFGESLVSWKSKKNVTTSKSLVKVEYRSLESIVAELT